MDSVSSSNVTIDDLIIDPAVLFETIRKSLTRGSFEHYVNGVCGLTVCLLGIISNALSFSVLIRRTMNLSTYVYLAALCLSDFITCLCLIPAYILDAYPIEIPDSELPRTYTYTKIVIITGAISTTARALSVWLCLAFTIDRWIMICRPFAGPLYCTIKNARRVTLLIYILGIFYAVPLLFEYVPHEERGIEDILVLTRPQKFYRTILSPIGQNSIFRWTYMLINALGVYVFPLLIIIIFNRQLLLSIRILERRSVEYNAPLPTKQGVTLMLVATTILLLTLRAPSMIIYVMWLINAKLFIQEKPPFPLRKFHSIANLCATLNGATTFIMFIIYGTKFRSEFARMYCCCLRRLQPTTNQEHLTNHQIEQGNNRLLGNNNNNHHLDDDQQLESNIKPLTNQNTQPRKSRHSSSTTTTTTSIASLPSFRRWRDHRRNPRYSIEKQFTLTNHNQYNNIPIQQLRQQESIISDVQLNNFNNDNKSTTITRSYSNWFKDFILCR